jgi:sterol 3beta-glucosyltransferase
MFMETEEVPYLYSFSENVVSRPADWHAWVRMCGFWFLDASESDWKPKDDLAAFLKRDDGRPIVYIGFGSIIVPDPDELTRVVVQAVKKSNCKAVISKGWSSRSATSPMSEPVNDDDVYFLSSVPHDWLFPQVDAVVHHGGAGTTSAGLRAGKPTVIKPFFGDQNFWATRITALGVGVTLRKLDDDSLADALKKVTRDAIIKAKAHALGERLRSENGVETAITTIHHHLPHLYQKLEERNVTAPSTQDVNALNETENLMASQSGYASDPCSFEPGPNRRTRTSEPEPTRATFNSALYRLRKKASKSLSHWS